MVKTYNQEHTQKGENTEKVEKKAGLQHIQYRDTF